MKMNYPFCISCRRLPKDFRHSRYPQTCNNLHWCRRHLLLTWIVALSSLLSVPAHPWYHQRLWQAHTPCPIWLLHKHPPSLLLLSTPRIAFLPLSHFHRLLTTLNPIPTSSTTTVLSLQIQISLIYTPLTEII